MGFIDVLFYAPSVEMFLLRICVTMNSANKSLQSNLKNVKQLFAVRSNLFTCTRDMFVDLYMDTVYTGVDIKSLHTPGQMLL